jgi:radical SAM protein with 4Fe4S-binding SPASM domain
VFRLHRLLTELATADDVIANLLYTPLYPYLSSLCRWERTVANCTTLETAIIDPDFNIKTCWQGTPLGKVGAPFPEIAATLKRYRLAARKTRGCGNCEASPTCMQCLFPGPLSLEGYCRLKTTVNTAEIAGMIREFDLFKAL